MAIDFPASPTNGQTYTVGSVTYTYDGTKWTAVTGSVMLDKIQEGNTSAEVIDTGSDGRFVVTTEGSERLRVDSSGRVGIGTTSPSWLLSLRQDSTSGAAGGYPVVQINNGNASGYAALYLNDSTAQAGLETRRDTAHLGFYASGAERARIDGSGRLLVGTTSSSGAEKLVVVAGSSTATGDVLIRGVAARTQGVLALQSHYGIAGNLISGDNLGDIKFTTSDSAEFARISGVADGTASSNDYPGRLVFSTTADGASSPTERMRIKQSGFTKISSTGAYYGESSPYHEIRSSTDNSESVIVSHGGTSGTQYGITVITANDQNDTSRWFFKCLGAATERFTVRSNGGLANYSANNVNLSDRNAKKDIAPATDTWDCLKEWEIVNFRYKDQPDDAGLNLGVIAQQIAESCPEVITVFQDAKEATETEPAQEERLGVKDQQMMWMAIKALQEAMERIEQLESKVAALEAS